MRKKSIFKKLFRQWVSLCVVGCMVIMHAAQAQVSAIDTAFQQASDAGLSGVLLVAKNGKIIFEKAHGYRHFETKEPLQTSDIFELASVSKQFTAMVIMQLQEKGLLQFDDPLEKYVSIPYKGITIRHMLNHTSGLPDYMQVMDMYWDKSKVAGNADVIEYLNKYVPPVLFAPGEKYMYSNTGYLMLASVAEAVSGKSFTELAAASIFKKLKMKNTAIRTQQQKLAIQNFAPGHEKDSLGNYVNANVFHNSDYTVWLGNRTGPGRISSTAHDLMKWDKALYKNKLVKSTTLEQAFAPATLNNKSMSNYGFGWGIEQDSVLGKIVGHTGGNPGVSTQIVRFIDKHYTIIVLCNNGHPGMKDLVARTTEALRHM
ncbi:MAG TPA: serine hydrolase domain-containing protein [Phnomibacter sp.]|nr:serine hydrolase domain-containing protein [Phnomibacter sp.]